MLLPKPSHHKILSNSKVPSVWGMHRSGGHNSAHALGAADPLSRHDMEDTIERLFAAGIVNQRQVVDLIDDLTPADVSRQEVAFNVALVTNEGLGLSGKMPTKSLLKATVDNPCKSDNVSSDRQAPHSFLANTVRQLAAIACYFAAIYAVGVFILTREVGLTAAIPLAVKTCAGKSLVAALIGPWIQRLTGVSTS